VLINDKMNTYNKRSIVWHNSLVKSRSNLNLHQKLWERNKIMFIPLHLLKTYIMNPETETKLCLCHSTSSDTQGDVVDTSVHICTREDSFSELGINDNIRWRTGEYFFLFLSEK
jgi:hypothetical protein